MLFPTTVKNIFDSFTSGGSTSMPIDFASPMNLTTASVRSISDDINAAMKCRG
ncbi:hypothetical protein D3C83_193870 [compost metagenome]